jgi:hypothetical protein
MRLQLSALLNSSPKILSRVLVTIRRGLDWMSGFIARIHSNSYVQMIQRYRWSIYSTVHRYTHNIVLSLH